MAAKEEMSPGQKLEGPEESESGRKRDQGRKLGDRCHKTDSFLVQVSLWSIFLKETSLNLWAS